MCVCVGRCLTFLGSAFWISKSSWHGETKQWWGQWFVKEVVGVKQCRVDGWLIKWTANLITDRESCPRRHGRVSFCDFGFPFWPHCICNYKGDKRVSMKLPSCTVNVQLWPANDPTMVRTGQPSLVTQGVLLCIVSPQWMQPTPPCKCKFLIEIIQNVFSILALAWKGTTIDWKKDWALSSVSLLICPVMTSCFFPA